MKNNTAIDIDLGYTVVSPDGVARLLNKSLSWVYKNAYALGASKIGKTYIFTLEGLRYAIETGQNMASKGTGEPADVHKGRIRNKTGSLKMGTRYERSSTTAERATRLGLVIPNR